ncbi:DUF6193 family natural product biosynthesis protein [Kineosporia succinea]|uniref:ESAT-6 protein secretion system EspG family protein n=1 Tax=Kineosporia succinea TaxID=84632 RepID=A0ABT9PD37_9ACTN|nr:DUF6193 family natural product biosynthesis protein [Kineosporia succinea]MDP9830632.1 hypothetical protein [Kineosporia succinea]
MNPLETGLYGDVVAAGGLDLAIARAARERKLDIGVSRRSGDPGEAFRATAEIDTGRSPVFVTPASDQRKFLFSAAPESRIVLLEGATDDLDALVEFLADFRGGVSLEDLDARFPFVWIGSGARAYEQGESTAAQWRELLTADWCREERPLVEAAYADTRLREIFPGLSHGALRFDAPLGTPRGRVAIVVPLADGTVRVERIDPDRGQRRVDVVTLPEAFDRVAELFS